MLRLPTLCVNDVNDRVGEPLELCRKCDRENTSLLEVTQRMENRSPIVAIRRASSDATSCHMRISRPRLRAENASATGSGQMFTPMHPQRW